MNRFGVHASVIVLIVLAGCLGGVQSDQSMDVRPVSAPCVIDLSSLFRHPGSDAMADPPMDIKGWENGIWADEQIAVDPSDGFTCAELESLLYRSMARVELIRDLEFDRSVTVEILDRASFQSQATRAVPTAYRQGQNVQFEALFLINKSTDAVTVLQQNTGTGTLAYYQVGHDNIVIIVDRSSADVSEFVIAHELVHALQDQHFQSIFRHPEAGTAALNGLIEGDANYVEYAYRQRCAREWANTSPCLTGQPDGSGSIAHLGAYLIRIQPYSDGPAFIQRIKNRSGWQGVNAVYSSPPLSTEQIIHPERYPDDGPTRVLVPDQSDSSWSPIDGELSTITIGEAGVFTMFFYPGMAGNGETVLISRDQFFNRDTPGSLSSFDPYNYSHSFSAGWDGDTLVPYVNENAETGYVWKLVWDSESDATEFVEGYTQLLKNRGATRIDDGSKLWRIPANEPFADAFYVHQHGNQVTIVNAPRVTDIQRINRDAT